MDTLNHSPGGGSSPPLPMNGAQQVDRDSDLIDVDDGVDDQYLMPAASTLVQIFQDQDFDSYESSPFLWQVPSMPTTDEGLPAGRSLKFFKQAHHSIQTHWGCLPQYCLPEELARVTPYSLALLFRLGQLAKEERSLDSALGLVVKHRIERRQAEAKLAIPLDKWVFTRPGDSRRQASEDLEPEMLENRAGVMYIDACNAHREARAPKLEQKRKQKNATKLHRPKKSVAQAARNTREGQIEVAMLLTIRSTVLANPHYQNTPAGMERLVDMVEAQLGHKLQKSHRKLLAKMVHDTVLKPPAPSYDLPPQRGGPNPDTIAASLRKMGLNGDESRPDIHLPIATDAGPGPVRPRAPNTPPGGLDMDDVPGSTTPETAAPHTRGTPLSKLFQNVAMDDRRDHNRQRKVHARRARREFALPSERAGPAMQSPLEATLGSSSDDEGGVAIY